ncbi:hypothetical protein Vretimale_6211 [Volvox reticuliferus]|nr:hypothetical protein Vretimale_6211 [Volvox reticuliferus]
MTMRGPDLALVDLAMRRHRAATTTATYRNSSNGSGDRSGPNEETEVAVIDAVLSYYRKYGHLVSCAVDLRTYVSQLGADAAGRLAEALQMEADKVAASMVTAAAAAGESDNVDALASLRRRVCAAQIRDDLGLPRLERCEEGVELSKELLELYSTAQPLQAGLDERERGAADELPVLAGAALVTAAGMATSDAAAVPYMLAAYGACADAVRVRPFGAGMRISLAALAALLAAPAAAATHMYKLDIKHIQLDTLGAHMLLPPLLAWPHSSAATAAATAAAEPSPTSSSAHGDGQGHSQHQQRLLDKALRDTNALFADHACDAGESLFTAYGHGMYTKVLEFTAFRERLAAAHTLAVVHTESGLEDCFRSSGSGGGGGGSSRSSGAEAVAAVDAVRSAAVAAAGRLNPDNLPTASSLRFNWDLSTRPAWLPPGQEGPSAAVLEWWRSRAAGKICGQGYGRCWWAATGSAEGTSSEAAQWRTSQASAAAHRWLLPHCIAGALGASGGGVLNLQEAVGRLKGLMGEQVMKSSNGTATDASEADGQGAAAAGLASCTTIDAESLRRLDVALYGAAVAVQDCLGSPPAAAPVGAAAADAACSSLGELAAAVRRLVAVAAADLAAATQEAAAWGGVLPGGPLAAMSLLVREPLTAAVCCIQSWQSSLKALRKRRTKAGNQMEGAAQRLMDVVTSTAEQLAAAAQECAEALTAATGTSAAAAAAAQAVRFLKDRGHAAAAISESATSALETLLLEQRLTVGLIAKRAAAVAAALR